MAQSRLERIGTIYTRISSLIKGGTMKPEDKPLWYAVYEAFPPKQEPRYDRAAPNIDVRDIFYKEDIIRAKFQAENNKHLISNLNRHDTESHTQKFVAIYNELEKNAVIPQEELYTKAFQIFTEHNPNFLEKYDKSTSKSSVDDKSSTSTPQQRTGIDIKEIFKE